MKRKNQPPVIREFVLEAFDAPNNLAWSMPKMIHRKLLNAYRTQTITAIDEHSCSYVTVDTFNGWLAKTVYDKKGKWVARNLSNLAQALKKYCEA